MMGMKICERYGKGGSAKARIWATGRRRWGRTFPVAVGEKKVPFSISMK
jgi:hypothetical protein